MALPPLPLSRRRFLAVASGATAGAVLLGGCGGGDDDVTTGEDEVEGLALAQFFGGSLFVAGTPVRAPFGVADIDGLLPVERTPERLSVTLLDPAGDPVTEAIDVTRRADGLPRAYFPLTFTVAEPGIYTARTEVGGAAAEMAVKIDTAADVHVIQPGADMPAIATPTTADPRGVDPICTREPLCDLHDATVAEVLAEGAPLALLVASPAFCQISICGPVLDVLLDLVPDHPQVRFLHAEVYTDPETSTDAHAPVLAELGLDFEPCLVLVGSDGTVAERIDVIFDRTELDERLRRLA